MTGTASIPKDLFAALRQYLDASELIVKMHLLTITIIVMVDKVIETEIFHFDHFTFEHLVSFGGTLFSIPELIYHPDTFHIPEIHCSNMHFSY